MEAKSASQVSSSSSSTTSETDACNSSTNYGCAITDIKVKTEKFTYKWVINNFKSCKHKTGKALESPVFSAIKNNSFSWRLCLYPRGIDSNCSDGVSLFLELLSPTEVEVECLFCLVNDKNVEVHKVSSEGERKLSENESCIGVDCIRKRDEVLRNENGILTNGVLTILCKITHNTVVDMVNTPGPSCDAIIEQKESKCFKLFLENGVFSDVTLVAAGRSFRAHKNILAASSPVFLAMFQHDMKEKQAGEVEIKDVDPEAVKQMLAFVYTGVIENFDEVARDLLGLADKYDIGGLRVECEKYICQTLNFDNAMETLVIADLHNAGGLKKYAMKFIDVFIKDVHKSPRFKALVHSDPQVILEAFRLFTSDK